MKEKANYPNKKNKNNKIDHFLAFRRKAKINVSIKPGYRAQALWPDVVLTQNNYNQTFQVIAGSHMNLNSTCVVYLTETASARFLGQARLNNQHDT